MKQRFLTLKEIYSLTLASATGLALAVLLAHSPFAHADDALATAAANNSPDPQPQLCGPKAKEQIRDQLKVESKDGSQKALMDINQDEECKYSFNAPLDQNAPQGLKQKSQMSSCWATYYALKKQMGQNENDKDGLWGLMTAGCKVAESAKLCRKKSDPAKQLDCMGKKAAELSEIEKAKLKKEDEIEAGLDQLKTLLDTSRKRMADWARGLDHLKRQDKLAGDKTVAGDETRRFDVGDVGCTDPYSLSCTKPVNLLAASRYVNGAGAPLTKENQSAARNLHSFRDSLKQMRRHSESTITSLENYKGTAATRVAGLGSPDPKSAARLDPITNKGAATLGLPVDKKSENAGNGATSASQLKGLGEMAKAAGGSEAAKGIASGGGAPGVSSNPARQAASSNPARRAASSTKAAGKVSKAVKAETMPSEFVDLFRGEDRLLPPSAKGQQEIQAADAAKTPKPASVLSASAKPSAKSFDFQLSAASEVQNAKGSPAAKAGAVGQAREPPGTNVASHACEGEHCQESSVGGFEAPEAGGHLGAGGFSLGSMASPESVKSIPELSGLPSLTAPAASSGLNQDFAVLGSLLDSEERKPGLGSEAIDGAPDSYLKQFQWPASAEISLFQRVKDTHLRKMKSGHVGGWEKHSSL